MRTINDDGRSLVKRFEQCRLTAYPDPATGGAPWTIGYGHTKGVYEGQTIDTGAAVGYLEEDLAAVERVLDGVVTQKATANQFAALCVLAFNVGAEAVAESHIVGRLNLGDVLGAAHEFALWDHAGAHHDEMAGLLRRRFAEGELFLTPD